MSNDFANLVTDLEELKEDHQELQAKFDVLFQSTDGFFLIALGVIVFLMQGGFALIEAGTVRTKNTSNILIKNILDCLLAGVAYWAIGWALAYGPGSNGFIGESQFFFYGLSRLDFPTWFFNFAYAATATTIVSGALVERCQMGAYFVYSLLVAGWVYPPVSHWIWDPSGWLAQMGYQDTAGSGGVHLLAGVFALVGCKVIGPRIGRFNEMGKPVDMPGHSLPMAALGGFILLFGFLAFNGGAQNSVASEGDIEAVSAAVINTVLGGCSGGLVVVLLHRFATGRWSYLFTLNGTLAGMVAVGSGCTVIEQWAALICGVIGALTYRLTHKLMLRFHLDDPLDVVAVHAGGGAIGVLMVKFFDPDTGIFYAGDTSRSWELLGVNLLGLLVIAVWSLIWGVVIFVPLNLCNCLRMNKDTEMAGADLLKHNEFAHPSGAWKEAHDQPTNMSMVDHTPSKRGHHPIFATITESAKASPKIAPKRRHKRGRGGYSQDMAQKGKEHYEKYEEAKSQANTGYEGDG